MPYYKTNVEAQSKYAPAQSREAFLKGVPNDKLFIPKEGQYRIRLMPAWSPAGYFAKTIMTHWDIGLTKSTTICPNMFREGSCPFCKAYGEMRNEYKTYEIDIGSGARPAKRFYSNIVNLSAPEHGVMVWSYGSTDYKMLMGLQGSGEYGDITDPVNGVDLILTRQGTGKAAKDIIYPVRDSSPIGNPAWLDQLFDLDKIFLEPDINDILSAFASHPWKIYQPKGVQRPITAPVAAPIPPPTTPVAASAVIPAPLPSGTSATPTPVIPEVVNNIPAAAQPITSATVAQAEAHDSQRAKDLEDLRAKLRAKMGG